MGRALAAGELGMVGGAVGFVKQLGARRAAEPAPPFAKPFALAA
jgi:hypothetical protein